MRGYKYLIFDVDGTLLNFSHAYLSAQRAIADKLGVAYTPEYISLDEKLGWASWGKFGLDRVDSEDVQVHYHEYYYAYLHEHFAHLLEELGLQGDAEELTEHYLGSVAASCELMEEDTLDVYQELAAAHKLALATNGVSRVQRPRLEIFLPVTEEIFISEELGCIKPSKAFFESMLGKLGCRPEECLMIGDSISSDIAGAGSIGMPTCWYNPKGKELPACFSPTYTISRIKELRAFCS